MRVLEVSRYKENFADHQLPFVTEQGSAIAKELRKAESGESRVESQEPRVEKGEPRVESQESRVERGEPSAVEYFLVKGNYVKAVGALKKKIREFKPDVVHAHFGLSAITAELQNLVPVVTTFHNGETLNWHVNLMSSLFSLRAKHVIYVAQHIRDLSYFKAKDYSIIPCGVPMEEMLITPKEEARRQLGWNPEKKYILFGGAFSNTRKNYKLLRDAVARLESPTVDPMDLELKENKNQENTACAEENISKSKTRSQQSIQIDSSSIDQQSAQKQAFGQPSAQSCAIVDSEDQLSATYKNTDFQSSQKNTKNNWTPVDGGEQYGDIVCIEMKGLSRAECVLRMCGADLFALPSHSEGSPQALKEAMAVNCPCLATDIADVRELFGDEPGHWILRNPRKTHERWDGDEHSIDEMVDLLNGAMMFEGRTNGRERILKLGLTNEQVAKRIIKIYEGILKSEE